MAKLGDTLLKANDWVAEVWAQIEPLAKAWAEAQPFPEKSPAQYEYYLKQKETELKTRGETRGVVVNAAKLNVLKPGVPKDVCTLAKAKVSAAYFFQDAKEPPAPPGRAPGRALT